MKDIDNMTIEDVDPELIVKYILLIGLDCIEKSNDENASEQDRVKYLTIAMKAQEFLGSIMSLKHDN